MEFNKQHEVDGEYKFAETEISPSNSEKIKLKLSKLNLNKLLENSKLLWSKYPFLKKGVYAFLAFLGLILAFKILSYSSRHEQLAAEQELSFNQNRLAEQSSSASLQQASFPVENSGILQTASLPIETVSKQPDLAPVNSPAIGSEALQQDIAKVAAFTVKLKEELEELTAQVKKLEQDLKEISTNRKKAKPSKVNLPVFKEPYTIRAIIPGRAWLISASGKSVDVKVGDLLPGYGEVKVISSKKGVVLMSDGSLIKLGRHDG